jgi:hypothetical protein
MKIKFISLGSFCHPKIFLRNKKMEILESLPFDFHSSNNFYSIYHILEELAKEKKVTHEFKEILYEHSFNEKKEKELAVKDNFDMFFLHFFKKIDLNSIPCEYPCSCEYLNDSKVKEIQHLFNKRYTRLYDILNNTDDILIFLRIENYSNPCWNQDLKNCIDVLKLFKNPNKYMIYSQLNISKDLDYFISGKLNFDYGIPVLFHKYQFDESITINEDENNKFNKVIQIFPNILELCIYLKIKNILYPFYHDKENNILVKLNDINIIYKIHELNSNYFNVIYKEKHLIFLKDLNNNFVLVNDY